MKILFIEPCNYIDFPVGGQLVFAKQMLKVFNEELKLVGISTKKQIIGKWDKIIINEKEFDFFPTHSYIVSARKPFIPRRITALFAIKKYKKKILAQDFDIIFTRAPEIVLAIKNWPVKMKIYYFAGTGNPLAISRRWYGRVMARFYDRIFFPALKKFQVVMAAADKKNIEETALRSKGVLKSSDIIQFPTRIDSDIFTIKDKVVCKKKHKIPINKTIIVTTGRLHWAKGWEFLLESFQVFLKSFPESIFYFCGDGDSRPLIEEYIVKNNLSNKVILLGFKSQEIISEYLNAADLFVMGSLMEGWATSLVEAKACGIPICTTDFSSAKELVNDGINGFVVNERNPKIFSKLMIKALSLRIDKVKLEKEIYNYSLHTLKMDLLEKCNLNKINVL